MTESKEYRGDRQVTNVTVPAPLDAETRKLVMLAEAIAVGDEARLRSVCEGLEGERGQQVDRWVDELLLQSILMVGYPRALVAAMIWRECSGNEATSRVEEDAWDLDVWERRGVETCRRIYRSNYERLRRNVRALHPVIDAWMVTEGYGRTISRPGLDLARRELCTVAQCAALNAPKQLHSHARGALHTGAAPEAVAEAVAIGLTSVTNSDRDQLEALWDGIRHGWERRQ